MNRTSNHALYKNTLIEEGPTLAAHQVLKGNMLTDERTEGDLLLSTAHSLSSHRLVTKRSSLITVKESQVYPAGQYKSHLIFFPLGAKHRESAAH